MGFDVFRGKESIDGRGFDESSYFGWEDAALIRPMQKWLDERSGHPFLMTVLTLASHHPYVVPRGFPTRRFADDPTFNDYLNTIAYEDQFLKNIFASFEQRGLLRDSLFVILGDHGEGFGQHERRQHDAVPYEEGLRIPLLLVGPGIGAGTRIGGLRNILDVAPTIVRSLGFGATPEYGGKPLTDTFGHERLYASCYLNDYCAVSIEGWTKVIHHFGRFPDQIFDLEADPLERHDLARKGREENDRFVERAVQRLTDWREHINALYDARRSARVPLFVTSERPAVKVRDGRARFEDFAELIGFDVAPTAVRAGACTSVTLLFQVLKAPTREWELFLHLEGTGTINADHVPAQGSYPVAEWKPGQFILDRHTICLRPNTPPEELRLRTGFWDRATGARAPVTAEAPLVATTADSLDIGVVHVVGAHLDEESSPEIPASVNTDADVTFGRVVRIHSARADRTRLKGGLTVKTTCVLEALISPGDRYEFQIDVIGPATRRQTHAPLGGLAPLSTWEPRRPLRDVIVTSTETDDPPGSYRVMMSLVDKKTHRVVQPTGIGHPIEKGRVQIAAYELAR